MRVRLYGVNTPERGQVGYAEAQAMVAAHEGQEVSIRSHKPQDKYGRWLAEVLIDGQSLSDALIASGHGVPYFGGKRDTSPS
jgi:endonuclease YncB( thermonuclease family)